MPFSLIARRPPDAGGLFCLRCSNFTRPRRNHPYPVPAIPPLPARRIDRGDSVGCADLPPAPPKPLEPGKSSAYTAASKNVYPMATQWGKQQAYVSALNRICTKGFLTPARRTTYRRHRYCESSSGNMYRLTNKPRNWTFFSRPAGINAPIDSNPGEARC